MKALAGFAAVLLAFSALAGQEARPVRDDVGFCWNPASMRLLVDYLQAREPDQFEADGLVAAIAPHDDYLLAGRVDFPLFKILRAREVVVFGVTHGTVRKEIGDPHNVIILDEFKAWPGLTGPVAVSGLREALKERLAKSAFQVSNKAHALEHSIEAELPWLQCFNPGVKITPIMVTAMPFEKMEEISTMVAKVVAAEMKARGLVAGQDVFFLISADGNHYGQDFNNSAFGEGEAAWLKGRAFDERLIRDYLTGVVDEAKVEGLTKELWGATYLDYRNTYWCGKYSIPFGLLTVQKILALTENRKIGGMLFRYSDSYSEGALPLQKTGMGLTAPYSLRHWVSWCSIGYYRE
ncbi:MAG: AmmeMemoRadiSam system protein B [Acidobacteriota bacterium]